MNTLSVDQSRFSSIDPQEFIEAYLGVQTKRKSRKSLIKELSPYIDEQVVMPILQQLITGQQVIESDQMLRIEPSIQPPIRQRLGKDGDKWTNIRDRYFVLKALGVNPDETRFRMAISRTETFRPLVIAVGYGFSLEEETSAIAVRTQLIARLLKTYLPKELLGAMPFPRLGDSGNRASVLERILVGCLAGMPEARDFPSAWALLCSRVIGAGQTDPKSQRAALLRLALRLNTQSSASREPSRQDTLSPPLRSEKLAEPIQHEQGFVDRVISVARDLLKTEHRYGQNVPIASVYDAYGRYHSDAGRLTSFKERLVAAAKRREINLIRLDLPESMPSDLRERSSAPWGDDHCHLIQVQ